VAEKNGVLEEDAAETAEEIRKELNILSFDSTVKEMITDITSISFK
jgi:hypothetical protein